MTTVNSLFPTLDVKRLTIQEIRRHQQFQTQLWRYLHIRYIFCILVCLVVVEILAHFLEDDTTDRNDQSLIRLSPDFSMQAADATFQASNSLDTGKFTPSTNGFAKIAYGKVH